jgi:hypothetical protein
MAVIISCRFMPMPVLRLFCCRGGGSLRLTQLCICRPGIPNSNMYHSSIWASMTTTSRSCTIPWAAEGLLRRPHPDTDPGRGGKNCVHLSSTHLAETKKGRTAFHF